MYNTLVKKNKRDTVGLIDDFFNLGESIFSQPALSSWQGIHRNAIEVSEDKNNVYVHAELPGVAKNDISLDLNNGVLSIEAKREDKRETKEKDVTYSEFSYGRIKRSVSVGKVDHSTSNAAFKDGILTITLPKNTAEQSNKIAIH